MRRHRCLRRPSWLVGALVTGVLLGACGIGSSDAAAPSGTRSPSPSGASAPATSRSDSTAGHDAGKPPLTGLIDMGVQNAYQQGAPFPTTDPSTLDAYAGAFGGIVVNEAWSQLEPSFGVEDWAPLDRSLAAVRTWNAQHPSTPLGVKLRIFAGYSAPLWVVRESGPPVTIESGRHRLLTRTMGRWWTAAFRRAWHGFQRALAARYDTNPLIRAVSVSSCSSITGEPFVVSARPATRLALRAAGWTVQRQESCLEGALSDYSGWTHTEVTFAFNPLLTASGPDAAFTIRIMQECAASKASGGPDCVLGNNDLSAAAPNEKGPAPVYSEIAALVARGPRPPSVYFQTVGAGVDCQAMAVAAEHHAGSVELWPPNAGYRGFAAIPVATLAGWNQALVERTPITC